MLASARRRSSDAQGRVTGKLGGETKASDASALAVTDDDVGGGTRPRRGDARSSAPAACPRRAGKTALAEMAPGRLRGDPGQPAAVLQPVDHHDDGDQHRCVRCRGDLVPLRQVAPAASAARSTPASASPARRRTGTPRRRRSTCPRPAPTSSRTRSPDVPKAKKIPEYAPVIPGMEQGIVALYQKCVHLGCRVPWCQTSQWFECPCHGSKYSRVGEKKGGPAPRGLDHFVVTIAGSKMTIDTDARGHRSADRHRHHRPGRRRAAVRLITSPPRPPRSPELRRGHCDPAHPPDPHQHRGGHRDRRDHRRQGAVGPARADREAAART